MAASGACGKSYWRTVKLIDGDGTEIEVALSPADLERANSDDSFAHSIFMRHMSIMSAMTTPPTTPSPGPSQPGPSQPGPSQPGPSQPGPSQPGPSVAHTSAKEPLTVSDNPQETSHLIWTPAATLLLISAWTDRKRQRESPIIKSNEVWAMIAGDLREEGHPYTKDQCSLKWRSLKQHYMKLVDSSKKTGRGKAAIWRFFNAMQEALSGDPAVLPVLLLESSQDLPPTTPEMPATPQSPSISLTLPTPMTPVTTKRMSVKRKSEWRMVYEEMKEDRLERDKSKEKMHDERMKEIKRSNDILERLLDCMKK